MTEERNGAVSNTTDSSQSRQRKKRKWDQPAESLVSVGVAVSGALQWGDMGLLGGMSLPGSASVSGALLTNPLVASSSAIQPVFPVHSIGQITASAIPKSNQHKNQDELVIAREIVINDAESSVRYKLTKRQTQEEIQKCTGAVVITRGKYRPPNAPANGDKPLYLHISAAAHLKDTAQRILAVDRAASMIEDMLKQSQNSQPTSTFLTTTSNGVKALSTCVFLGFDADPSLNIASRIRGPNDQYINHIMNETGATVALKGRGSGNFECLIAGEEQQPLHLFLSASNSKSLEDAKLLAQNLLDTISLECASRVSSSKTYGAVPPPEQFISGVQSSSDEHKTTICLPTGLMSSMTSFSPSMLASSVATPSVAAVFPQLSVSQSGETMNLEQAQSSLSGYTPPTLTQGTSYIGYGGIYPQVTPLQQVALALRQSPSTFTSTVTPTTSVACMTPKATPKASTSTASEEKRPPQKRKFQELPINTNSTSKLHQGQESVGLDVRNVSTMPAPKKLVQPSSGGMPPPPPRDMAPPRPPPQKIPPVPLPPKFLSPTATGLREKKNVLDKAKSDTLPDTLIKLVEYGEEDDDDDDDTEETVGQPKGDSIAVAVKTPFWA